MNKNRQFGKISFPDKPELQYEAWLTVDENEIVLEAPIPSYRTSNWPLLIGKFNSLGNVTLVNGHAAGGVDTGPGGPFTKIKFSYGIRGIQIDHPSKLLFNKVVLTSPTLADWIIEKEHINEISDNVYQIPKADKIIDMHIEEITLSIYNSYEHRSDIRNLKVKKICTICLQSRELIKIDNFAKHWAHLKKFILFITDKNPEFNRIWLFQDGNEYDLLNVQDDLNDKRFTQAIPIFYPPIENHLQSMLYYWFDNKQLSSIIDLVLERSFNSTMSHHAFFLNICVSLETFNQRFLEAEMSGVNERAKKREEISSLIGDTELLKWFEEQSSFWKNPTLRDRLSTYKNTIEKIMGKTFTGKFDIDTFIGAIVKTRNDIAHRGEFSHRFNYTELFLAAKTIEYTIRLEILKLLTVPDIVLESLMEEAKGNISSLAYLNNYNQSKVS